MNTIAVIEDDEYIGSLLEECLAAEGYMVIRAYSGTEALLLLEKQQPDLILLDLMLPGLSGEALLPRIKNTPVIVVSAKVGIDEKVDLLLNGAVDYITKPFEMRELLARIAVQLRLREDHNARRHAASEASEADSVSPRTAFSPVMSDSVMTFGSLSLDTETRELIAPLRVRPFDPDGSRHLKKADAKCRTAGLQVRTSRGHQSGYPRLYGKLPENPCQQSAEKNERGRAS